MLDKTDRKLLCMLQQDCTQPLQVLADAVNLTSTPCWKRLKRLEEEGYIRGRVALLDNEKLGLGLTAFVLIKTQQHSSEWYQQFVQLTKQMPEVLAFYRMAGEYDYLMQVEVADMKSYDSFYKRLVNGVPDNTLAQRKACKGQRGKAAAASEPHPSALPREEQPLLINGC
ncbi:Leucine-responsive regulatory protein [Serratia quinivorans]|nr:Leucine-responsive regulatory protein [Serratia quinivorans]